MAVTEPKISERFPTGYGDLLLQSSDGVICYFPSQILGHVSCAFRDMLSIGGSRAQIEGSLTPVKIAEPIKMLELFLTHIDPGFCIPHLDPESVEGLLQMGEKYQVNKFLQWFEEELTIRRGSIERDDCDESILITHPLVVIVIAAKHNLEAIGRRAMRELIGGNASLLVQAIGLIPPKLLQKVHQLRKKRVDCYKQWIMILTVDRAGIPEKVCDKCVQSKGKWIYRMMDDIQDEPTWKRFFTAYENQERCPKDCKIKWSDIYSGHITFWKPQAQQQESQLPDWPI